MIIVTAWHWLSMSIKELLLAVIEFVNTELQVTRCAEVVKVVKIIYVVLLLT